MAWITARKAPARYGWWLAGAYALCWIDRRVFPLPSDLLVHSPGQAALVLVATSVKLVGLIALWLWRHRDAYRPGVLFASYLILSGTERLLIEFIRRNSHVLLGLTAAQIESLAMIVVGSLWLALLRRSGSLRHRTTSPQSEPLPTT
jgi:phosphatidylglycerol:prolipoprotein diacylglycerol transferase